MEERELTAKTQPKIRHFVPHDIMLNTAQMRDAIHVQRFRIRASAIDRENAILTGAASEIEVQKQKGKGKAARGKGKALPVGALVGRALIPSMLLQ